MYSLLLSLWLSTPVAHAADVWRKYYEPFGGPGTGVEFINVLSVRAANFFLILVSGGAVLAIMYGGVGLIRSVGNDEGRENAKKIILFAIGGLILALISRALLIAVGEIVVSITAT